MEISTSWVQSYNCITNNYKATAFRYSPKISDNLMKHSRKDYIYDFIVKLNKKINKLKLLGDGWADYDENKAFSHHFLKDVKINILKIITSLKENQKIIFFPVISPMEINSIDIHWSNNIFQLLVNVMETEDGGNVQVFGREYAKSGEFLKWHGNINQMSNAISGWLKSVV